MKDSKIKVLDFKTTKEPIKVLGVNLSYNTNKCIEKLLCKDQENEHKIELMDLKRSHDIRQIEGRRNEPDLSREDT